MAKFRIAKILVVPSGTTAKLQTVAVPGEFDTENLAREAALKLTESLRGKWGTRVVVLQDRNVVVSYDVGPYTAEVAS